MSLIYKICSRAEWEIACADGRYQGSAVDHADGFIHMSAADQVRETARRWFAGRDDLVLVAVDPERLDPPPVWEASRGGALFPHLYAPLPLAAVVSVQPLTVDAEAGALRDFGP